MGKAPSQAIASSYYHRGIDTAYLCRFDTLRILNTGSR
jgi:hypothetical protein